jgi:uncharacterized protein with PIN domain
MQSRVMESFNRSMNEMPQRGRCPQCGTKISALQAATFGTRKPFECRRCGRSIQKASSEFAFVAMGLATFWVAKSQTDSWFVLASILLGLCIAIVLKSQHRTMIELHSE